MRRSAASLTRLFILLALVSAAYGRDGGREAKSAIEAAQALGLYLDELAKAGKRPDYSKPPASELFRHVFDTAALQALPAPRSADLDWLLAWGGAADQVYKRVLFFGMQPGQAPDPGTLSRNIAQYQDQHAAAVNFMIRLQARLTATIILFLEQLPTDQRTAGRAAGLQQSRAGAAQLIAGALASIAQGMAPANARLVTAALRDTRQTWATYLQPADRGRIAALLVAMPKIDATAQQNLAAFADALASANAK